MEVTGSRSRGDKIFIVVVGWREFTLRVVLATFVVVVVFTDTALVISQSVITPKIVLSGNPLQSNELSLRSTIFKLGSCSSNTEKFA